MKWVLISVILLYRRLPSFVKRKCLFKETCSAHVLRLTRESGFGVGMRALRVRMLQCRSGYVVFFDVNIKHWIVRFANGSVANRDELAEFVLSPYLTLPTRVLRPDPELSLKSRGHAQRGLYFRSFKE
jgi:uncharacterized protein